MSIDYGESAHYKSIKGELYYRYQNRLAERGAKLNARKFSGWVGPDCRVMDFGCGGGWLLKELTCKEKVGVELNVTAHEDCVRNGIRVYESIDQVEEIEFDVIITHHCLEHVPYPIEALRALRDKLRASGLICIVVPVDDWRVERDHTGGDIDHHLHTWTPRLMANTLVEAGFKVVEVKILNHAWFPGWAKVHGRIPMFAFEMICYFWSIFKRRRQLVACAVRSHGSP